MEKKAKVDAALCIGCGMCKTFSPTLFKMVDGKAVADERILSEQEADHASMAAEYCPVKAIVVG